MSIESSTSNEHGNCASDLEFLRNAIGPFVIKNIL